VCRAAASGREINSGPALFTASRDLALHYTHLAAPLVKAAWSGRSGTDAIPQGAGSAVRGSRTGALRHIRQEAGGWQGTAVYVPGTHALAE
jgi:hypothetical protein